MTQQWGTGLLTLWDQLWRGGRERLVGSRPCPYLPKGDIRKSHQWFSVNQQVPDSVAWRFRPL